MKEDRKTGRAQDGQNVPGLRLPAKKPTLSKTNAVYAHRFHDRVRDNKRELLLEKR